MVISPTAMLSRVQAKVVDPSSIGMASIHGFELRAGGPGRRSNGYGGRPIPACTAGDCC
jgi:hypothetical protein